MISGTAARIRGETDISVRSNSIQVNGTRLLAEARTNPTAFTALYRRHYDAVFRYCVHRLFERHAAEDVTSAVFLKVVENLARFKGDEQQFRNWLYRIATNEVNNRLRRTARQNGLIERVRAKVSRQNSDCRASTDELNEKLAMLKQAVLTLKPKYQAIITLRFFENMKLTQVAEVLGASPGTIRSQLARALGKLRKRLAPLQQEV
ncbi:MAG TPA: sigma-70 family RNA polymerase sigma factor [Sedimentisphaerales bacterium]|nr:sigma-70 family RNA polymerase sigma factor [Sedimentisphaerales bacterium]